MKTATKKLFSEWMQENGLTIDAVGRAIGYSFGAVAKWSSGKGSPSPRAVKEINHAANRRDWTPFLGDK